MKTVKQRVSGRLVEGNGRYALLLLDDKPGKNAAGLLYLRYAFVTQGTESPIFPAFILDDWGGEIKSLALYDWFHEYADQFPRAEVFGLDGNGRETQRFLRELDLYSRWPCYAYTTPNAPVTDGLLVEAILLPGESIQEPVKIKRPSEVKRPLCSAKASWWRVNPAITTIGFL